ncbi:hypothetical protein AAFF_G00270090 [Aldrovandia affinis]|uniref:Uncharacterized protein n=1 Tax=Aldrovandia affinis TaxID=143900 RepID=A0AAD7SSU7_9TELE|nr:hypothetical protein AAFF_G00270090 [Aldrovandia affinis]
MDGRGDREGPGRRGEGGVGDLRPGEMAKSRRIALSPVGLHPLTGGSWSLLAQSSEDISAPQSVYQRQRSTLSGTVVQARQPIQLHYPRKRDAPFGHPSVPPILSCRHCLGTRTRPFTLTGLTQVCSWRVKPVHFALRRLRSPPSLSPAPRELLPLAWPPWSALVSPLPGRSVAFGAPDSVSPTIKQN